MPDASEGEEIAVGPPSLSVLDLALTVQPVEVGDECVGQLWQALNLEKLARLIAGIAMGQAAHVVLIAQGLRSDVTLSLKEDLRAAAIRNLTATKEAIVYHRDGFLFECISWLAAQKTSTGADYMVDPHIRATKQGLDGLSLRVDGDSVTQVVIFEDKCTEHPRRLFQSEVLPSFRTHHKGERAPELLASISELLKQTNLSATSIPDAADSALDHSVRHYRAGLTVDSSIASKAAREALFKGYSVLDGIVADRRLGATFQVGDQPLREWFAALAAAAIEIIKSGEVDNV